MKVKYFKTLLIASAFALALSGCSQSEPAMPKAAESSSSEAFSEYADVIAVASESYYAINSASRSANFVSSVRPWLKKDILKDCESYSRSVDALPDTLLYIVNYSNEGGSVLVSDNEIFKGVLAVIDEGNIDPNEDIEVPGMRFYLESFCEALKTNKINETTPLSEAEEYLPQTTVETSSSPKWVTTHVYSASVNTKWGQGHPYNMYCFTPAGEKALAGCVPIAIAQLLTYYKHPNKIGSYDVQWKHLSFTHPSTYEQADNSAKYISEIGKYVHASYGETSTSVDSDSIPIFLKEHGFSVTETGRFADLPGLQCIQEYGPFIVGGMNYMFSGHGWVVDGAQVQRLTGVSKQVLRFLFHCNWGWDGKYNGYFLTTAFDPYGDGENPNTDTNYQYGVRTFYFIKKNS
ncbi:MAG: C10 family peptidase [Muribaculaceae bacterium]|nr:C10 family peptidase [Muribaculaceae bacterium]MDE6486389.1 C10 family peptidase [Muribaculaceae bacterium]